MVKADCRSAEWLLQVHLPAHEFGIPFGPEQQHAVRCPGFHQAQRLYGPSAISQGPVRRGEPEGAPVGKRRFLLWGPGWCVQGQQLRGVPHHTSCGLPEHAFLRQTSRSTIWPPGLHLALIASPLPLIDAVPHQWAGWFARRKMHEKGFRREWSILKTGSPWRRNAGDAGGFTHRARNPPEDNDGAVPIAPTLTTNDGLHL